MDHMKSNESLAEASLANAPESSKNTSNHQPRLDYEEEVTVLDEFSRRHVYRALDGQTVDETLVDIVERQARAKPGEIAVVDDNGSLTYHELVMRGREVATFILQQHEAAGKKYPQSQPIVGMGLERSREWVIAMVGIMMAGMGYCPLDPTYPRARIENLVEQTELQLVLTTRECIDHFRWLQEAKKASVSLVEDLKAHKVDMRAIEAARPSGEDICYILFTSGSTGTPKGVVVEHQGVRNMVHAFRPVIPQIRPDDVRGQLSAMTFDLHAMDIYCAFDVGATVAVCGRDQLLTDLAGFIRRHSVKGFVITPTVAALLDPAQVPSLCWLAFGGEQVPRALIHKWISAGRTVIDHYGPTECSVAAACHLWKPKDEVSEHIGRPLDGAHIYILGPKLELLPIGVPGELCISGIQVSRGYLKRPDLTSRAFVPNPYSLGQHDNTLYKTGDRCQWTSDGTIQFHGRIDFQVKIRGNRVEPGEVEDHASKVVGVARCVVILREDDPGHQYLACYMMIHDSAGSGDEISQRVRETLIGQLPLYMVPAAYIIMDQLPQTSSGKVDRKALPIPPRGSFLSHHDNSSGASRGEPCRNEDELLVARVFLDVLTLSNGPGEAGSDDEDDSKGGCQLARTANFFELGGNSFSASQTVAHVQQAFGLPPSSLTIREFFEHPTVAEVAAALVMARNRSYLQPHSAQQKLIAMHKSRATQSASPAVPGGAAANGFHKDHVLAPEIENISINGNGNQTRAAPWRTQVRHPLYGSNGYSGGSGSEQSVHLFHTAGGQVQEFGKHSFVTTRVPLSQAQEIMWLVLHIVPNPEYLDITDVWRVKGELDATRLQSAMNALLRRHQALRMRFNVDDTAVGARILSAILDRWSQRSAENGTAPMARVTTALAGVVGPMFLRNMHRLFSCINQIDQDPTLVPFCLEVKDLSHLPPGPELTEAVAAAIEFARRPFDMKLAQGLLFRATIVREAPGKSILVFMWSHLIFDGISSAIFYQELMHVYNTWRVESDSLNPRGGTYAPLPDIPSYENYVSWESEWLQGGAEKKELAYWRALLGRDPPQLCLSPRPKKNLVAVPSRGAWLEFTVEPSMRSGLEAVAHRNSATLNMAMLAAFHLTLHAYSSQRHVIVGMLVARRPLGEHQGMIGHVADIRPILIDFRPTESKGFGARNGQVWKARGSDEPVNGEGEFANWGGGVSPGLAFEAVLAQVRERVLEALEHQSVTFRMIVSEVLAQPDFARSALIQAYFNFQQPGTNASPEGLRLGHAQLEHDLDASWAHEGEASLTAVSLLLRQLSDGSLRGRLVYQADLFDRHLIEAIVHSLLIEVKAACKVVETL